MPSRAGNRVMAATIVTATMTAAPQPIMASIGMPETCTPTMARMTVAPANTTESPAVALASPTASGTPIPESRFWRCRDRMKSA